MKPATRDFKRAAAAAVDDRQVQANLEGLYRGFHHARERAAADTPDWEAMRDRARQIKAHTLANLDHYLAMAERNVRAAGGDVFFAVDADAAARYVLDLACDRGVRVAIVISAVPSSTSLNRARGTKNAEFSQISIIGAPTIT